jgi:hypothetical protein
LKLPADVSKHVICSVIIILQCAKNILLIQIFLGGYMRFNWDTTNHGKCIVSAHLEAEQTSVVIRWGKEDGNSVVEYRIVNSPMQAQGRRLESATRLAMGHFDTQKKNLPALVNLAIDSTSVCWEGQLPMVEV